MSHLLAETFLVACIVMAAAGCVYALAAALVVRRFSIDAAPPATTFPGVTILKPLAGAESRLYENLESFCKQSYPGPMQWVFGVQDPNDASIPLIHRLRAELPDRDIELVVDATERGSNPKVSNLVGMQARIRHGIVIVADSDIAVTADYVTTIVRQLMPSDVGVVTCLYRGEGSGNVWGRLASMAIDYRFLPDVLVGLSLGLARPCFGSTLALRRTTLQSVGGFEVFLDQLADDNALGAAVRAKGLRVELAPCILVHTCHERTAVQLLAHELRWARTVRVLSPWGYAGLIITHPLPFALFAAAVGAGLGNATAGLVLIAVALVCRLVLQVQVDRTIGVSSGRWRLSPARDMLSFSVYAAGFFISVVSWRGVRYHVRADGTLAPLERPKA
jgi:ceramide glucosyltransferase